MALNVCRVYKGSPLKVPYTKGQSIRSQEGLDDDLAKSMLEGAMGVAPAALARRFGRFSKLGPLLRGPVF